ncbi:MAG: hypothetical protein ACI9MC_000843 [Kiritimatiellia bacterium]
MVKKLGVSSIVVVAPMDQIDGAGFEAKAESAERRLRDQHRIRFLPHTFLECTYVEAKAIPRNQQPSAPERDGLDVNTGAAQDSNYTAMLSLFPWMAGGEQASGSGTGAAPPDFSAPETDESYGDFLRSAMAMFPDSMDLDSQVDDGTVGVFGRETKGDQSYKFAGQNQNTYQSSEENSTLHGSSVSAVGKSWTDLESTRDDFAHMQSIEGRTEDLSWAERMHLKMNRLSGPSKMEDVNVADLANGEGYSDTNTVGEGESERYKAMAAVSIFTGDDHSESMDFDSQANSRSVMRNEDTFQFTESQSSTSHKSSD